MSAAISTAAKITIADELLTRSLQLLRNEAEVLVECHSHMRHVGAEVEPVPGTVCAPATDLIAEYVELIRDIETHLGGTSLEGQTWFDDLLARRNGWEGSTL